VIYEALNLGRPAVAVLCVLMLRGPQTVGEIRTRTNRLYDFSSLEEVESTLNSMASAETLLVVSLARQAGQKEIRYAHLLGGDVLASETLPDKTIQKITPFLWFNDQAEEAATFYVSIFKKSKIVSVTPMTVSFELEDVRFTALNGGPTFRFTEAVSFVVHCDTQDEIDYYWNKLGEGGDDGAQRCGWLKDKYGLSWQIVPRMLGELLNPGDPAKAQRAMQAMLQMKKLDIRALQQA
jgi:predicted 3-demethylubiquinone-9 3-methyltransferase (glyoxalase superfamily)